MAYHHEFLYSVTLGFLCKLSLPEMVGDKKVDCK